MVIERALCQVNFSLSTFFPAAEVRKLFKLQLIIHVRHFPPGTSKWNKIEHRMFCHITENWRGRPLESRMAVGQPHSQYDDVQGIGHSVGVG